MIQQDPDTVLQWVRDVMNATDNHIYGTGSYDNQQATQQQTTTQQNHPSKYTTMKDTHRDLPLYMYETLLFLTTHYKNTKDYADKFPLYTVPKYTTKKQNKNHDHGDYLYRQ